MKNTWIITAEFTAINGSKKFDEEIAIEALKAALDVDDVVITKTQLFEGADEETEGSYTIDAELVGALLKDKVEE